MNKKFPKKNHTEKHDSNEFKAEREAAGRKFTESDRQDFWKNFDKDSGSRSGSKRTEGPKQEGQRSERKDYGKKSFGDKPNRSDRGDRGDRKPFNREERGDKKPFDRGERKSFGDKPNRFDREERGDRKPFNREERGDKKPFDRGERKSFGDKPNRFDREDRGDRKPFNREERGDKKPFDRGERKSFGDKPNRFDRADRGERKPFNREERGDKKPFDRGERKSFGDKPNKFDRQDRGERKPYGDRPSRFEREERGDRKPFNREDRGERKSFDRGDSKSFGDKPKRFNKEATDAPKKKTFQDVMNNAYSQRFDRGEVEKVNKEERPPIEFEGVELENRFETKGDKKPSFRQGEKRKDEHRRTDKNGSRTSRQDAEQDKKAAFLEHFDYENPNEKAYDAQGNKGVRTEQQQAGNDEIMPLNKFIAHSGVCSRRDAVELIKNGKITINGKVAAEPGYKVQQDDVIQLDGKPLKVQKNLVYVLLNKPKGFITTTDDPKGRRTVMDIFGDNIQERVFPVGRLDRNTTGLLLLTNDGDVAQQLSHPKYENRKIYQVTLDRHVAKTDFEQIINGLELEDGLTRVDQLAYLEKKNEIGIEIHSGKNRIVRRIFEHLGYEVEKLDRVMYAGLTKKNLKRGQWRFLTKQEVINLKHLKR